MDFRRFRRCAAVAWLAVTMMGLGSAVAAQPQPLLARPGAASYAWGNDGWYYMLQGGRWVRTNYRRVFPDARHPQIYDLYEGGRFIARFDVSLTGWVKELPAANLSGNALFTWVAHPANAALTDANTWILVKANNQWMTMAAVKATASARSVAATGTNGINGLQSGTIGGVRGAVITTINPSGVDVTTLASHVGGYSYRPLGANSTSPKVREQGLALDAYLNNRRDASIKVDSLHSHVRVPYVP